MAHERLGAKRVVRQAIELTIAFVAKHSSRAGTEILTELSPRRECTADDDGRRRVAPAESERQVGPVRACCVVRNEVT